MKFESKKSVLARIIFWSFTLIIVLIALKVAIFNHTKWLASIGIIPTYLLTVTWFNTYYLIKEKTLEYKSGFINGTIEIIDITQITVKKTSVIGLRPALSANGCMIKSGKSDNVFVSPENQELFNAELLKINPEIKIVN